MAGKEDKQHLNCLKEEQSFLIRLQTRLQKQLRDLKVEEAALLKMISMAARGGPKPTASQKATGHTHEISTQSTLSFIKTGYSEELLDDTVVNQAPLDLKDLRVEKVESEALPLLHIGSLSTEKIKNIDIEIDLDSSEREEEDDNDDYNNDES